MRNAANLFLILFRSTESSVFNSVPTSRTFRAPGVCHTKSLDSKADIHCQGCERNERQDKKSTEKMILIFHKEDVKKKERKKNRRSRQVCSPGCDDPSEHISDKVAMFLARFRDRSQFNIQLHQSMIRYLLILYITVLLQLGYWITGSRKRISGSILTTCAQNVNDRQTGFLLNPSWNAGREFSFKNS